MRARARYDRRTLVALGADKQPSDAAFGGHDSRSGDTDAAHAPIDSIVFLLAQVFDGILTYVAVSWLGVVGEGNLLLATAMQVAGAGPALFGAKTLAAGCGLLLYTRGLHGVLGV